MTGVSAESFKELSMMFKHLDRDKSGKLDHPGFKSCLQSLGYDLPMVEEGQADPVFQAILDVVDPNRDGHVSLQECMSFMTSREIDNVTSQDKVEMALLALSLESKQEPHALARNLRTNPTPIHPSRPETESIDPRAGGDGGPAGAGGVDGSDDVDSQTNSEPQPLHTEDTDEAPIVPSRVGPEGQQPPPREDDGAGDVAVTENDNDGDNGGSEGKVQLRHLSSREDQEGRMSNLCVDGEIDVMILDDSNGVAQHYQLELFIPYQLSFHHGVKQLVFHHGKNQPVHIPHSLVLSYRQGREGESTLHLYFPSGKPLTLSVSSIERVVSGLEALAVPASPEHEEVSPEGPLKTDDFYQQQTNSAAYWKNDGHHDDSGYGTPGKQPPQHPWSPNELHPKSHNQLVVSSSYPGDASSTPYSTSGPPPPYSTGLPPPQYPTNFQSPLSPRTATPQPYSVGQHTNLTPMPPHSNPNPGGYSTPPRGRHPLNRSQSETHLWRTNQSPSSSQYIRDTSPSPHTSLRSPAAHPNSMGPRSQRMSVPPYIDPTSGDYYAPPRGRHSLNRTQSESHLWAPNQSPSSSQYMRDTSPSSHTSHLSTAAHPNSMGPPSQPMSGVTIHNIENYHQYPSGYTGPARAPSTTHRPPYGRSRLTESATVVSQNDMLKVQTDVSTAYERVGRLLGMEDGDIQSIKAQNSGNLEEASYQLMKAWVGENGSGASRARLATALYEARLYDAAKIL